MTAIKSKRILSYEILEEIGIGGMGIVYRGIQVFQKKDVAIKSLSPQYCRDEEIRNRFKNEAEILSRLNHPNIVKILDFINKPN